MKVVKLSYLHIGRLYSPGNPGTHFCQLQCSRKDYVNEIEPANSRPVAQYLKHTSVLIGRAECDGTRAETRFGLSAKRTRPFKSAGVSVQSNVGSRGVRISGQLLYYL